MGFIYLVIYLAVGVLISSICYAIGSTGNDNEDFGAAFVTVLFWPFVLIGMIGYKIGQLIKKALEK